MRQIPRKEMVSYGVAGFGQNMVYILSSTFLLIFYTDIFGVEPWIVGTIFLVARIWDAVNDFIMGAIVDNTRTRWGKLRPYLLFAPLPIAILTILTFSTPNLTDALKIVYIAVTYIMWGMAYTIGDVPYWGLSASMSSDTEERTKLISFARFMTMLGSGLSVILIPILIDQLGGNKEAYLITAILISVVGCGLFFLAFFGTKERVIPQNEKTSLVDNLKLLAKNVPLLIILLSSVLGFARFMSQSAGTYLTKYNMGDETLFSLLGAALIASVLVAIAITPLLLKFTSKRNLYIYSSISGTVFYTIMYFLGYNDLVTVLIFIFLSSLSMGFFNVLQTSMIADSVDYLEWKTGKRAEGLCYASQTFFFKLSGALTAFTIGLVLQFTGFVKETEGAPPIVQKPEVYEGIFSLVTIIPAIGCLLSIIPMFFYKFTEEKQRKCMLEVQLRKKGDETIG